MKIYPVFFVFLFLLLAACQSAVGSTTVKPTAVKPTAATEDPVTEIPRTLPDDIDAQGHRGARGLKPENTLPAFETALDLGVDTLELDLHYTNDGVVVIWHDDKIEKDKCGLDPALDIDAPDPDSLIKWGEGLMISRLSFEQIGAYVCDRNPDEGRFSEQNNGETAVAAQNYHIISLAELFDFVDAYTQSPQKSEAQRANAAQVRFNIETKRKEGKPKNIGDTFDGENPGAFELEILRLIDAYGMEDRVIVQSFDHRSLWAIRSVNDTIQLAALSSGKMDLDAIAANGADIWSPKASVLTISLIEEAHALGLQVIPWTVNEPDDMRELIEMGVDGLISDRPDLLLMLGER